MGQEHINLIKLQHLYSPLVLDPKRRTIVATDEQPKVPMCQAFVIQFRESPSNKNSSYNWIIFEMQW